MGVGVTERLAIIVDTRLGGSLREWQKLNIEISKTDKSLDKTQATVQRSGSAISSTLKTAIAGGAIYAGIKVVKFGLDAARAASDMNESVNKSAVVFGKGQGQVLAFAATAAKSLGISRQEAVETTATFGNFFEALGIGQRPAENMSISLVKLAADLASFNNADPTQVLQDLRSGLAGEVEPLRKFGIDLSEAALKAEAMRLGLGKIGPTLTGAQKAQAAYSLIMRQTTTAQGDFARTSGGVANQTRILTAQFKDFQATVGKTFLPVLSGAVHGANDLLGPLSGLVEQIQGLPGPVKTAAVDFGLLFGAMKLGQKAFGGLFETISNVPLRGLSVSLEGTVGSTGRLAGAVKGLGGGLKAMATAIGPANIAMGGLAIAGAVVFSRLQEARKAAGQLADVLVAGAGTDIDAQITALSEALAKYNEQASHGVAVTIPFTDVTVRSTDAASAAADKAKALSGRLDELRHQKEVNTASSSALAAAQQKEADAVNASSVASRKLVSVKEELANPKIPKAIDVFGQTVNKTTGRVLEQKTAVEQLNYQYDKLTGRNISAAEAQISFEQAVDDLTKSVHDNGRSLDVNSQKGRDNRTAMLNAAKAAQDLSERVGDTRGYEAGRAAMIESRRRLVDLGIRLGLTKEQVQTYADTYLKIPAARSTRISTPGAVTSAQQLANVLKKAGELPARKSIDVTVRIRGTDVSGYYVPGGGLSSLPRARAMGGWIPGQSPSDTADNIPIRATAGEFVIQRPTARRIQQQAPGYLEALNAGQVDVGGDKAGMRLRYGRALAFAAGGSVPAVQGWMWAQDPKPYVWGAAGPGAYDCSGLASGAYGLLTGRGGGGGQRYFTTASSFGALGFRRGTGVFTLGVNPGTHMAFSVGGLRGEAASTATGIHIGSSATSPSRFAQQWYLPGVGGLTDRQIHQTVSLVRGRIVADIMRELGVRSADRGATLAPGLNLLNNQTGRPERLTPDAVELGPRTVNALGEAIAREMAYSIGAANAQTSRASSLYVRSG